MEDYGDRIRSFLNIHASPKGSTKCQFRWVCVTSAIHTVESPWCTNDSPIVPPLQGQPFVRSKPIPILLSKRALGGFCFFPF